MSRTYSIVCHDCRKRLWAGQGWPKTKPYIYKDEKYIKALEDFLFNHQQHKLEFGDDEYLNGIDDYEEVKKK